MEHAVNLDGYRLIGVADGDQYLVFSHLWSWQIRVYDQIAGYELPSDDDEFPRFVIEDDHLIDLDLETQHPIRFTGDQ